MHSHDTYQLVSPAHGERSRRYPFEAFGVVRLIGACGVTVQTERTPEEADVFAACGMGFVEPRRRERGGGGSGARTIRDGE